MSNFQILFDQIGELARRRHQAAEESFASLGLNHTEARLLGVLHQQHGAAPQDEITSQLTVDRSNAVRALQRLERGGYIVRSKDEVDKRANRVRMTDKGRKIVIEISKLRKKMVQTFFGELTDDEAGTVATLLHKALSARIE